MHIKFFAPQVRRLFEGDAYLKFGRHKESYLLQLLKRASFDCQYSSLAEVEVALAVLGKFAAFTTFTELRVRVLNRKTNGRAIKLSLITAKIAFDAKKCSSLF